MNSIRDLIIAELQGCLRENSVDLQNDMVSDSIILFETGLDSLGFAVLVTRLEILIGFDPFTLDPNPFYPKTLGEFVTMYEKYKDLRKHE